VTDFERPGGVRPPFVLLFKELYWAKKLRFLQGMVVACVRVFRVRARILGVRVSEVKP
jgi:hypothetical protein